MLPSKGTSGVFVGLGWDATASTGILSYLKKFFAGKVSYHDLDLVCFMFDRDGHYVGVISGKADHTLEHASGIYHSGDDQDGLGDGDDEQISVELARIPDTVSHLVFKVAVDSGDSFKSVRAPELRLVDAYSDHIFLKVDLAADEDADKAAYVLAELYRDGDDPDQWMVHFIGEYFTRAKISTWKTRLRKYLTSAKGD